MSGNELLTYLGQVATKTANTGGYAQFGGIKMTVDCQAKSVDIATIGGRPSIRQQPTASPSRASARPVVTVIRRSTPSMPVWWMPVC